MNTRDQSDDGVRVFVSHRHEDHGIAEGLRDFLETLGAGRLQFFLSEEIPGGEKWLAWIKENLQTADLLLLLYTAEDARWDWCLYEAGLFEGKIGDRKLVVLHPPGIARPSPLTHLQMIEITPASLEKFICEFFGTSSYYESLRPLNPVLTKNAEKVENLASDICTLFDEHSHVIETTRWKHLDLDLALTRDQLDHIKTATDYVAAFEQQGALVASRARIAKTTYVGSYEIFGLADWVSDLNLQDLHDRWSKCEYVSDYIKIDWLRDVCLQIIRVLRNETAVEIRAPLKSGTDPQNWYLPVINRVRCSGAGVKWSFRLELYRVPKDGW